MRHTGVSVKILPQEGQQVRVQPSEEFDAWYEGEFVSAVVVRGQVLAVVEARQLMQPSGVRCELHLVDFSALTVLSGIDTVEVQT